MNKTASMMFVLLVDTKDSMRNTSIQFATDIDKDKFDEIVDENHEQLNPISNNYSGRWR